MGCFLRGNLMSWRGCHPRSYGKAGVFFEANSFGFIENVSK